MTTPFQTVSQSNMFVKENKNVPGCRRRIEPFI